MSALQKDINSLGIRKSTPNVKRPSIGKRAQTVLTSKDSNRASYSREEYRESNDVNYSEQLRFSSDFQFRNQIFPLRRAFNPKRYYYPIPIGTFSESEIKAMFREIKFGYRPDSPESGVRPPSPIRKILTRDRVIHFA